ncbi:MAG: DUF4240 domain-containing protein [Zoogloeaceae bacterium]|jgi:hypothetical protein|nr:DUF4240 domain-containing protein [Zoogloeaceae bacterium]
MAEEEFWQLISLINKSALENQDGKSAVAPVEQALAGKSVAEIQSFHALLSRALYDIDGEIYADNAGESGESDDAFLYARCYVIAQGKEHYNSVKADPNQMPTKSIDQWCESLLYVAPNAWGKITDSNPDEWDYFPDISFETGSNTNLWT